MGAARAPRRARTLLAHPTVLQAFSLRAIRDRRDRRLDARARPPLIGLHGRARSVGPYPSAFLWLQHGDRKLRSLYL